VGSVSFICPCWQRRRALSAVAKSRPGRGVSRQGVPERFVQAARGWAAQIAQIAQAARRAARACAPSQAEGRCQGEARRSWRPPAGRGHDGCQGRPIGRDLLDDVPVACLAMRAAADLDGGHAAHEGLRLLARLRVGRRHRQQLPRQRQALGLGRRGQQPVVADLCASSTNVAHPRDDPASLPGYRPIAPHYLQPTQPIAKVIGVEQHMCLGVGRQDVREYLRQRLPLQVKVRTRIAHRRVQTRVSEPLTDRREVHACLQQMNGRGMAPMSLGR